MQITSQSLYINESCALISLHSPLLGWLTQCLKISEKISFKIASEASYVYLMLPKKDKVFNFTILQPVFGQTVLPDSSIFNLTKIAEK